MQQQSRSRQSGAGGGSLMAPAVSARVAHRTGARCRGAGLLSEPYSTQWQKSSRLMWCSSFSFCVYRTQWEVKMRSVSFLLSLKVADESGAYNVKRWSAFPRARYNVSG